MADAATLDVLVDGLTLPEGPRWHDGRLWFAHSSLRSARST
jgi:hypothetical protein